MKTNKEITSNILFIAIIILFATLVGAAFVCKGYMGKVDEMKGKIIESESKLYVTEESLASTKKELKNKKENIIGLKEELDATNKELDIALESLETVNTTLDELKSSEYKFVYMGDFKITHYCNEKYEHICGYGDGLTATGVKVNPGTTIAVDPHVIPYGTQVYIEGYGWRKAQDCGGGVDDNHIDVAVNTHSEAMSMGVRHKDVWALVKK